MPTSRTYKTLGWFFESLDHDGMDMGSDSTSQGHRKFMKDPDWQTCYSRKLVMSIYVKA
jgi:hypothetical protein